MIERVDLVRGGWVESSHKVHFAVVAADGGEPWTGGDPSLRTYFRSSAKPFQALPLVDDGVVESMAITAEQLAICCASHSGEPRHVELVDALLDQAGLGREALECGAHPPFHEASAERLAGAGAPSEAVHNNCSGKHAGMLALAVRHGWEPRGYVAASHPVQRRMLREIARWTSVPESEIGIGVDGCGVACFALPVRAMALAYARFAAAAEESSAHRVTTAMTRHPWAVAGSQRLCTAVMEAAGGRVFCKVGAEGVYGAGIPALGLGLALKVEDGAWRAAEVALVALLEGLGALDLEQVAAVQRARPPIVRNRRGDVVGHLHASAGDERRPSGNPSGNLAAPRDGAGSRGTRTTSPSDPDQPEAPRASHLRALVTLAAALAAGNPDATGRALEGSGASLPEGWVDELILQSHLFLGYPRALEAMRTWRSLGGPAPVDRSVAIPDRARRGEEVCRVVYGGQFDRLRANVRELHPALDDWMIEDGYGRVLARPGLGLRERELAVVSQLAVMGAGRQLRSHLRGALHAGATPAEIVVALEAARPHQDEGSRAASDAVWADVRSRADLAARG